MVCVVEKLRGREVEATASDFDDVLVLVACGSLNLLHLSQPSSTLFKSFHEARWKKGSAPLFDRLKKIFRPWQNAIEEVRGQMLKIKQYAFKFA